MVGVVDRVRVRFRSVMSPEGGLESWVAVLGPQIAYQAQANGGHDLLPPAPRQRLQFTACKAAEMLKPVTASAWSLPDLTDDPAPNLALDSDPNLDLKPRLSGHAPC